MAEPNEEPTVVRIIGTASYGVGGSGVAALLESCLLYRRSAREILRDVVQMPNCPEFHRSAKSPNITYVESTEA